LEEAKYWTGEQQIIRLGTAEYRTEILDYRREQNIGKETNRALKRRTKTFWKIGR
jgi:hypothetical protein